VDPVDPVSLARELIDIDSTTGREGEVATRLATLLRARGYAVLEQPVEPRLEQGSDDARARRFNVIAAAGEPDIVFSTHFDCVPPFFPSRLEGDTLYGRGACDAKGILAAQLAAAERLRAEGETRIGLVFVAGEERGSDGAMAANRIASRSKYLINGEPTDNRLGVATRGVYRVRLRTRGRAAHSGYPELGESAIEKLIDILQALRAVTWPADDTLGTTHYSIGLINGGIAPNVVPPLAEAEVVFRSVGDHDILRRTLAEVVSARGEIEEVVEVPPARCHVEDGFDRAVFSYTTDIPFLSSWGTPLLLGPGSIHVAHTDREHVSIAELSRGVDLYVALARRLLQRAEKSEA
jgi:acetylornithine deacetylase